MWNGESELIILILHTDKPIVLIIIATCMESKASIDNSVLHLYNIYNIYVKKKKIVMQKLKGGVAACEYDYHYQYEGYYSYLQ